MQKFISNYEDACAKLGRSTELPDVSKWSPKLQRHLTALHKLDTLLEVNNAGWEGDLANIEQKKWYPVFDIINDEDAPGGFRLSFFGSVYVSVNSDLGVRPACCSEELSDFMGRNCPNLYKDLHS